VGFTTGNLDELERQVTIAAAGAVQIATSPDSGFAVWEDASGAALWIQVAEKVIVGAQPFFAHGTVHTARIEAGLPDAEHPLDGGARLYVLPAEKTVLRVDVLNWPLAQRALRPQAIAPVRIAAFAESLQIWESSEAYAAAQPEAKRRGTRWIVPTGLYPADKGGTDRATATIAGTVIAAEERVNTLTGSPFLWLRLETAGFTLDAVSAAAPLPAPGAAVHGHFWLAAVVDPAANGSLLKLAAG
jgi:hypothetical protein